MRQIVYMAAFWLVVVIAIRLAVCFPRSLLARVLFSEHGPHRQPGESRARSHARAVRYRAGWLAQSVGVFAAGWIALRIAPGLGDSLAFIVFWAVIVPFLAACALAGTLWALACMLGQRAAQRGWKRRDSTA